MGAKNRTRRKHVKSHYRLRSHLMQGEIAASVMTSRRSLFLISAVIITVAITIFLYLNQLLDSPGEHVMIPDFDYSFVNDTYKFQPDSALPRRTPLPFCRGILKNYTPTISLAIQYMKKYPRLQMTNEIYLQLLNNCDTFINERGYIMQALSDEEENFPLAYDILMHKDVEQAERLLRAIYMPQNYYCIHIDKKASVIVQNVMRKITRCFPNVFIASKLENVKWGTISVLQADLNCMQDLLKFKKWKYFINLTGQEMPLKSNRELVRTLKAYEGANEVEGYINKPFKFRHAFRFVNNRRTNRRKSPPPHQVRVTHGAVHIVASRKYVDFVINNRIAKDFKEWVKDTYVPDELFFSSLNGSPHLEVPGSYRGYPTNDASLKPFLVRYKLWDAYDKCEGYFQRNVCIFSIKDLHRMMGIKHFFLNKFELEYEYLALDCMEEWIYNKTMLSTKKDFHYDVSFYKQLAHVKNHVKI